VSCSATILSDNRFYRASLLDISLGGCRAGTEASLAAGVTVQIALEAFHSLGGKVRWCRDGEIGIQFSRPIGDHVLAKWKGQLEAARDEERIASERSARGGSRDFWGEARHNPKDIA
jgi:hypothetical protein